MIRTATQIAASALFLAGLAHAQDPFGEGVRWTFDADAATPWLPQSVSFSKRENLAFVGTAGATPSLAVLDRAAFGVHSARLADTAFGAGASHVATLSGWDEDLFTALQVPSPTKSSRRTLLARHDPVAASQGAPFAPTWVHDAGFLTNGPARLGADAVGELVVLAVWDNKNSQVQIDWLAGQTGALAARVTIAGAALNGVEVSADGDVVVVSAGLDLYIFDGAGRLLQHELLAAATKAISLSDDGSALAVGGIGQLALFTEGPAGTWTNTFNTIAPKNELAAAADLSADGTILGLAWWNYATGTDLRLEIWDVAAPAELHTLTLSGGPNSHQNLPQVVEVSPDGRHVAFGNWGDGGPEPEVIVFRVGDDLPLYRVDTPGSVRDLDLSQDGDRLLVAYKHTHNNVFSNSGGVLMAESGEQKISQLEVARTGQDLPIATRLAGAGVGFLLIGERAAPTKFPGVDGSLLLDRATLQVLVKATQGGRADFLLAVPDDPSLIGTQYSMQAAWRAGGGTVIGPGLIDPLIVE